MSEEGTPRGVLAGKRIVLGVSGGISAYKAIEVCRRLVDAGAHVVPIMTQSAEQFIGKVTLSALASEPVHTSLWDDWESPIPHTKLGQNADLVLVCPATAHVIGSFAAGISDDLLTNTLLATRAPVMMCAAMHTEMWENAAVADNIARLRSRGIHIVEPAEGRLAGGDIGKGRLAEPETIVEAVVDLFDPSGLDLRGLRVLVTAGGTASRSIPFATSAIDQPASRVMRSPRSPSGPVRTSSSSPARHSNHQPGSTSFVSTPPPRCTRPRWPGPLGQTS